MPRFFLSCFVCGLSVLILAAAPPSAAEPAGRAESRAAGLAGLWSWLVELWSENGCYIDPYGCPGSVAPRVPAENENGCFIDPNGGCGGTGATPIAPDNLDGGCYIDPYGGCGG